MNAKKPLLFEYLHINQYLKDYFEYRKNSDANFSFDFWAKELGFQSKSYLRMILIGRKKVSEAFEKAFALAEVMSEKETEYFHFLILHSQAQKQSERQLYAKKLIGLIQSTAEQAEVEKYYEFLQDPVLPVLQTLLSFNDITPSVKRLSVLMGLPDKKTLQSLEKLAQLQLAESYVLEGEVYWRSKNNFFKVPNVFGDIAVEAFHRHNLLEAAKAFALPKELRRFRCLLLPMNEEELLEFYKMADDFATSLLSKYRSDEYIGRRLFKVNFVNFPVVDSVKDI